MKLRTFVSLAVCLAVVLTAWLLTRKVEPTGEVPSASMPKPVVIAQSPDPASDPAVPAGRTFHSIDEVIAKLDAITLAQLSPWLDRTGRTAEVLVAAWELTRDPSLAAELAEKHSQDPRVCLTLLNSDAGTADPVWVDRLRHAAPDHPLPDCLDAAKAAKSNDLAATKAALALALTKKGRRDNYQNERMVTLREAAAAAGLDAHTAAFAPAKALQSNAGLFAVAGGANALIQNINPGNKLEAEDAAATAITLAEHLRAGRGDSLMADLFIASVHHGALKFLPADTELGESGGTLGEAAARQNELRELAKRGDKLNSAFGFATPAEVTAYFDRFTQHGEAGAMEWALQRIKAGQGQ